MVVPNSKSHVNEKLKACFVWKTPLTNLFINNNNDNSYGTVTWPYRYKGTSQATVELRHHPRAMLLSRNQI